MAILNLRIDVPSIELYSTLNTTENANHVASMIRDRFNDRIRARYEDKIADLMQERVIEWLEDLDKDTDLIAKDIRDFFNSWIQGIDNGYQIGLETLEATWE